MGTTNKSRILGWALCALSGAAAFAAHAQARPPVTVSNAVYQEVEVRAPDGTSTKKLQPAARVVPGGEVIYRISYGNDGDVVATNVAIDNPLPKELVFLHAETEPTAVSVDGGQTFGKLQELTVIDDEGDVRPAQPADITHLRWVIASLAPGESGSVAYRARVK